MDLDKKKLSFYKPTTLADALTLSRLYLILPITILVLLQAEKWAGAIYILAVFTDAIDGAVARLQQTASAYGAALDGVVDFWFGIATLIWIALLMPGVYTEHVLAISIGIAAFIAFLIFSYAKNGHVIMPHLYSAKVATFLFALWLPLGVFYELPGWLVWLTAAAVVLSRVESTLYALKLPRRS